MAEKWDNEARESSYNSGPSKWRTDPAKAEERRDGQTTRSGRRGPYWSIILLVVVVPFSILAATCVKLATHRNTITDIRGDLAETVKRKERKAAEERRLASLPIFVPGGEPRPIPTSVPDELIGDWLTVDYFEFGKQVPRSPFWVSAYFTNDKLTTYASSYLGQPGRVGRKKVIIDEKEKRFRAWEETEITKPGFERINVSDSYYGHYLIDGDTLELRFTMSKPEPVNDRAKYNFTLVMKRQK